MSLARRVQLARRVAQLSAAGVRCAPRFQGQTLPGRLALAIDPDFLMHRRDEGLAVRSILVTGTNGKTTTTALVKELLGPNALSNRGSNLPWGVATVLAEGTSRSRDAVFEVDEAYVPSVARSLTPAVLVWLNMSRDQLDRSLEVRRLAARIAESATDIDTLVANAGDPLIVAHASEFRRCLWVKGPEEWRNDALSCPRCTSELLYETTWRCVNCGLHEPEADYQVDAMGQLSAHGEAIALLHPGLPGSFNLLNASLAVVAVAAATGGAVEQLARHATVTRGVEGRFTTWWLTGVETTPSLTTYLAKNPAGWHANLAMLNDADAELVLGLNAKVADGRDTSWIWDVAFESLGIGPVIATGERATDLALRLEVAGFDVTVEASQRAAIRLAASRGRNRIVYLGNYTAFRSLIGDLSALGAIAALGSEVAL